MVVRNPTARVMVPEWVVDHASFLRWIRSGDVPYGARVAFVRERVWIDTSHERFVHNRIKTHLSSTITGICEDTGEGVYFTDGMLLTTTAGFSTMPDGTYIRQASCDAGRVRFEGDQKGRDAMELVGVPDLVIEVVSDSSADEVTAWLTSAYWNAAIPEYWVVDARVEPLQFAIYRRRPKGYSRVRTAEGWSRSSVLSRSFRFVDSGRPAFGRTDYRLEMR